MARLITSSSTGALQACPKYYHLKHIELLQAKDKADALLMGTAFHSCIEAWRLAQAKDSVIPLENAQAALNELVLDRDHRCKLDAMLAAYNEHHYMEQWRYNAIEFDFRVSLSPAEIAHPAKNYNLAGVIDALVQLDSDRIAIVETKTTAKIDQSYIDSLWSARQTQLYWIALERLGMRVDCVIYDVIEKPKTRRKKATPPDLLKYKKDGTLYATCRMEDEHDEAFIDRIREWYREHPDAIQRFEIRYTRDELKAMESDLLDVAVELDFRETLNVWPRALSSCYRLGRRCEFTPYCGSGGNPIILESHFEKRESAHSELKQLENDNDSGQSEKSERPTF